MEAIIEEIMSCRQMIDVAPALVDAFTDTKIRRNDSSKLKIAVINLPCNGFGDVIYAKKIRDYVIQWYGCSVTIFTTFKKGHLTLGSPPSVIKSDRSSPNIDCVDLKDVNFSHGRIKYDIFLVAPIVTDFSLSRNQIGKSFKHANRYNTFFMSEYNPPDSEEFTFPTGIGNGLCGIFLVKPPRIQSISIKNPFCLAYVASSEHISGSRRCYSNFFKMISNRYYRDIEKLDIVTPPWLIEDIVDNKTLLRYLVKFYPNITAITQDRETLNITVGDSSRVLTIRGDILPCPHAKMFTLIAKSLPEILITGDQSLTDVLSCKETKDIYYQIADWKEDLAKELSKATKSKHLRMKSTSCGKYDLSQINYDQAAKRIVDKWDFRKLGKPIMDGVFGLTIAKKNDPEVKEFMKDIQNMKRVSSIKKHAERWYN